MARFGRQGTSYAFQLSSVHFRFLKLTSFVPAFFHAILYIKAGFEDNVDYFVEIMNVA